MKRIAAFLMSILFALMSLSYSTMANTKYALENIQKIFAYAFANGIC